MRILLPSWQGAYGTAFWWSVGDRAALADPRFVLLRAENPQREARPRSARGPTPQAAIEPLGA